MWWTGGEPKRRLEEKCSRREGKKKGGRTDERVEWKVGKRTETKKWSEEEVKGRECGETRKRKRE